MQAATAVIQGSSRSDPVRETQQWKLFLSWYKDEMKTQAGPAVLRGFFVSCIRPVPNRFRRRETNCYEMEVNFSNLGMDFICKYATIDIAF